MRPTFRARRVASFRSIDGTRSVMTPSVNIFLDLDSHSNEEVLTHALAQAVMEADMELKHR